MASTSPYALDIAGCNLINLEPMKVGTVRGSVKRNLIKEDFSDIEFLGDSIEKYIVEDFKIPITSSDFRLLSLKLPKVLGDIADKIITPKTTGYTAVVCLGNAVVSGIVKNKTYRKTHKASAYIASISSALLSKISGLYASTA